MRKFEPVYIGKREDTVDQSLATWINNYPEKEQLKILFIRETEGVYHFGSRRVLLKIGANNNIQVQVGGGFMSLAAFIDKFEQSEFEKI